MGHDVVITGVGPVTPVGVGGDALWASLRAGRSQVASRELRYDVACTAELPIASMPPVEAVLGLAAHNEFLGSQEFGNHRDLAYALLAMELALEDAGIEYDRDQNRLGMVQAFEAPGVEATVCKLFQMISGMAPAAMSSSAGSFAESSHTMAVPSGPPSVYDMLAPSFYGMQAFLYVHLAGKAFGLHGFCTSVHNACSSGAYALEVAAQQIRSGQADVMIVVGAEAFETAVRLEWFRRLDLYAKEPVSRPFDDEPGGFYVGEGGGAIVLESGEHAARRGAGVYARYLGGAWAHQGWKQTVPDVRAGRLRVVVSDAMSATGVAPADVDLIVPHGAGTVLSDRYESDCIGAAMDDRAVGAVATGFKPYVGHTLAASGIVDTICALLAMKHRCVPATLHTRPDHCRFPVPLAWELVERPIKTLLKTFTGFTGHDAALLFCLD
jgi:3-oxoacyl-(acyl-carrier-protein) synthase